MTETRHFTASAIVFDAKGRVLLVHHIKAGVWLYPGGHIDPNEDPAQAAVREVEEEPGVEVEIVAEERFRHHAVGVVASPFAILVMPVSDSRVGPHHHIDMVYVCRARSVEVTPQTGEVSGCVWVPVADVAALVTPPELPSLIAEASSFLQQRS